jgi:hypothetical protein
MLILRMQKYYYVYYSDISENQAKKMCAVARRSTPSREARATKVGQIFASQRNLQTMITSNFCHRTKHVCASYVAYPAPQG